MAENKVQSDLLPCIHCGSPMEFNILDKSFPEPNGKWFVGWDCGVNCTEEYCSFFVKYFWAGGGMTIEKIEAHLAKKWNRRY